MCDVTTALALGAMAAGTAMQAQGANQADQAQAAAIRTARAGQTAASQNSVRAVNAATDDVARPQVETALTAAGNVREAAARAAAAPEAGYLPGQDSAPQIVRDEIDRRRGIANLFVGQQAGARANLSGWGDVMQNVGTRIGRAGEDVATQGSFARGEAGTLPLALGAAARTGSTANMTGNLLTGAGMLGASGAFNKLGGLFASGAPAATPTTAATRVASTGRLAGPV